MKKIANLNAAFTPLILALLFMFSACKKDAANNDNLIGKWQTIIPLSTQKSAYEFKSDQSYEHTLYGIDTVTKKDLGILARETGKYKRTGAKLVLYDILSYLSKDGNPAPVDDLKAIEGLKTIDYDIAVTGGNKLILNHQCGINELCTANYVPPFYYRLQ